MQGIVDGTLAVMFLQTSFGKRQHLQVKSKRVDEEVRRMETEKEGEGERKDKNKKSDVNKHQKAAIRIAVLTEVSPHFTVWEAFLVDLICHQNKKKYFTH